jgi:hypothetical protein
MALHKHGINSKKNDDKNGALSSFDISVLGLVIFVCTLVVMVMSGFNDLSKAHNELKATQGIIDDIMSKYR